MSPVLYFRLGGQNLACATQFVPRESYRGHLFAGAAIQEMKRIAHLFSGVFLEELSNL